MPKDTRKGDFYRLKPEDRLGDQPIEEKHHRMMTALAHGIDEILNGKLKGHDRKTGFVLMVFDFGADPASRCNYISNGTRQDVIVLMKEMLARFEGQPEIKAGPQ